MAKNKKRDVQEVCKFSEVVEKLAREEEPHPARLQFAQTNVDAVYMKKGSEKV